MSAELFSMILSPVLVKCKDSLAMLLNTRGLSVLRVQASLQRLYAAVMRRQLPS